MRRPPFAGRSPRGQARLLLPALFLVVLLRAPGSAQAEDYSRWSQSTRITINTTSSGAGIAEAVDSFPMLVRLPSSHPAFERALPSGADLRFSDADGRPLPYEIERFEPAARKAEIWVLIPRVDANSPSDHFRMHWGKVDAASRSSGESVFDKDGLQYATLHLGEKGVGNRVNSAWAEMPAVPANYDGDESREGVIARCDSLDGAASGDHLNLGGDMADFTGGLTLSAWHRATEARGYERILDLGSSRQGSNILLGRSAMGNGAILQVYSMFVESVGAPIGMEPGLWRHLAVTVKDRTATLYVDGRPEASVQFWDGIPNVIRDLKYAGRTAWPQDLYYKGMIDELAIAAVGRSPSWIKLAYETQKPASAVLAYGAAENAPIRLVSPPAAASVKEGASVTFRAEIQSAAHLSFQWRKDGKPLPGPASGTAAPQSGAVSLAYALPAASLADSGAYSVTVTDGKDTLHSPAASLRVSEDYALWSRSLRIAFNTTSTGAGVDAGQTDFPVPLRLDASRFDFASALPGGADIRLSDPDGTPLAHQVAHWDAAGKSAEIWVRVPEIAGNSRDDYITLHWGRPSARPASDPAAVFRADEGYVGVWHLNDPPSPSPQPATAAEAAGRPLPGVPFGVSQDQAGALGRAYRFQGPASRVALPGKATAGLKTFTLSLWAKETAPRGCEPLLLCPALFGGDVEGRGHGDFWIASREGRLVMQTGLAGKAGVDDSATTAVRIDDGAWHHVTAVHDGAELVLYEAGKRIAAVRTAGTALAAAGFDIGNIHWSDGSRAYGFGGLLDAVSLASAARTADWVKLAHATQAEAGNTALVYGGITTVSPTGITLHPPPGSYPAPLTVTLGHADSSVRVFYTLDGSAPVPAAGTTREYQGPLTLARSAKVTAVGLRAGQAGASASAEYEVWRTLAARDTLEPGERIVLPGDHALRYPTGIGTIPVTLESGVPGIPAVPAGFEAEGPVLRLGAAPGAAFPPLEISRRTGSPPASLFRIAGGGVRWEASSSEDAAGGFRIREAGDWFWGADVEAPSLRPAGAPSVSGDTLRAAFAAEDNVENLLCRLEWWDSRADSTAWIPCGEGAVREFRAPLAGRAARPLEARFAATDRGIAVGYPDLGSHVITVSRPVDAGPSPVAVEAGRWTLAAFPLDVEGPLRLADLEAGSGKAAVAAGVWVPGEAPGEGAYRMLAAEDTLPAGSAVWLAAGKDAALSLPPSRTLASDSLGAFALRLRPGWNLVAGPSLRPLPWVASRSQGDAYLQSPIKVLHRYADPGYAETDTLRPWEGFFVYNTGADTVVRLQVAAPSGGSLPGAAAKAARTDEAAPTAAEAVDIRLSAPGGASLRLGARAWASDGLGVEDEPQPPRLWPGRDGAALLRQGRTLGADILRLRRDAALRWTLTGPSAPLAVALARLPVGFEAWEASPSGRAKRRLRPGDRLAPVPGDSLLVFAGTPGALAALPELRGLREAPGRPAFRVAGGAGGPAVLLELPSNAKVTVRAWRADGARLRSLSAELGPGWHRLPLRAGPAAPGAAWAEVSASGPGWTLRRVLPFTGL